MDNNDYCDLNPRKLLSFEGKKWSHLDLGLNEDSSSNDLDDGKSDTSSSTILPAINGITFNSNNTSFGVGDTMKLKEEDMYLFGLCPAWDPFYLAVCEYCGQVIKPQALAKHIEMRHRLLFGSNRAGLISSGEQLEDSHPSSLSNSSNSKFIQNKASYNGDTSRLHESNLSGSNKMLMLTLASSDNDKDNRNILLDSIPPGPGPGSPHVKSCLPGHSGTSSPFNNVSVLGSCSSAASSPNSSNSSLTVGSGTLHNSRHNISQSLNSISNNNSKSDSALGNGNKRNSQSVSLSSTTAASQSKSLSCLNSKKASFRVKQVPCKDREYDPDKHCGVKIGDMDKPCTRSLTCKTHSLTLRRSVPERSKNFDELLAEHRATKEAAMRAAGIEVKLTKQEIKRRENEAKRLALLQQQQQLKQQQQQAQQQSQSQQHHLQPQQQQIKHQPHQKNHLQQQQFQTQQQQHNLHYQLDQEISQSTLNQTAKDLNTGSPSSQTFGKQEKRSPILARQLNDNTSELKCESNSSLINPSSTATSNNSPCTPNTSCSTSLEKANYFEVDGSLYLPNHPKPMALCTFNARQISIGPLNCDQDESRCNLSSRLFTRKRDLTYAALSIFRDKSSQDNSPRNQKLLSLLNIN